MRGGPSRRGLHRVASAAVCPRAFVFRDIDHLLPLREPEERAVGIVGHLGLEAYYLLRMGVEALPPAEAMRKAPARLAFAVETATSAVAAYLAVYSDSDYTPLDVERELRATVGGRDYTQRIDLVVQKPRGVLFVDHKLVGRVPERLPERYETDPQMAGYWILGEVLAEDLYGSPFAGVELNFVGRERPHRCRRLPVPRPGKLWREAFIEALKVEVEATDDEEARARGQDKSALAGFRSPARGMVTGACYGRYNACDYLTLCLEGPSAVSMYEQSVDKASDVVDGGER